MNVLMCRSVHPPIPSGCRSRTGNQQSIPLGQCDDPRGSDSLLGNPTCCIASGCWKDIQHHFMLDHPPTWYQIQLYDSIVVRHLPPELGHPGSWRMITPSPLVSAICKAANDRLKTRRPLKHRLPVRTTDPRPKPLHQNHPNESGFVHEVEAHPYWSGILYSLDSI